MVVPTQPIFLAGDALRSPESVPSENSPRSSVSVNMARVFWMRRRDKSPGQPIRLRRVTTGWQACWTRRQLGKLAKPTNESVTKTPNRVVVHSLHKV
jgi:hypothetical protein